MNDALRDAIIKVIGTKEYVVQSPTGVMLYFDTKVKQFLVYEPEQDEPDNYFNKVDVAVDYFLKITKTERISRTEEEIELGLCGPLD
jgi:hypothetical protein